MTIDVGRVAMINISDIEIGDRVREVMGDLEGLETSMKQSGLAMPLCVKEVDGGTYLLLAGERRLAVLIKNGVAKIPARIYKSDISPVEIKSIELAENLHRKDFEYWEHDIIVKEIHLLQQSIHGAAVPGPSNVGGWAVEDTGKLMGASVGTVMGAMKRANARETFPELFEDCKTKKDALKVIDKLDEEIIKDVIAKNIKSKASGVMKDMSDSFVLGDFFEEVKEVPDKFVRLVEIDPPYAIDLTEQKKKDGAGLYNLNNYNEVNDSVYPEFLLKTFTECHRVMTDHSWLICWFAPEPWFETVYNALDVAGFKTTRMCGIWTKGTSGQSMNPSTRLANCYEMFFYAWKGQPVLAKAGSSNEFHHTPVTPQLKTHPTERPVELMKDIYETFAFPGSKILIPFLGSGNGILSAQVLGMSAFGYDLSKAYKDSFLVKAHSIFNK